MFRVHQSDGSGNIGQIQRADLKAAREYLAALEALAHMGRASKDPAEIKAALRTLAQPSEFLRRLAGVIQ